jgi:hypothetical protein
MIQAILLLIFGILVFLLFTSMINGQEYERRIDMFQGSEELMEKVVSEWELRCLMIETQLARKEHRKARTIEQLREIL